MMDDKTAVDFIRDSFKQLLTPKSSLGTASTRDIVHGIEYGQANSSDSSADESEEAKQTLWKPRDAKAKGTDESLLKLFRRLNFGEVMKTSYKSSSLLNPTDAKIDFCRNISKGQ